MKFYFLTCLLTLALTAEAAMSSPALDEVNRAYEAKDYPASLTGYAKLAADGNAVAQNKLGEMYANGVGTSKDEQRAVSWYRKAAEQGDVDAQYNLGVLYASSRGPIKDEKQAVKWYRRAADQGDAGAQYNLSLM